MHTNLGWCSCPFFWGLGVCIDDLRRQLTGVWPEFRDPTEPFVDSSGDGVLRGCSGGGDCGISHLGLRFEVRVEGALRLAFRGSI